MHATVRRFVEEAERRYDLSPDVREFDEGTRTAADAAAAVGCEVAQIASSIVMEADDDLVVVVTSGANRVDEERVADAVGATSVEMADPDAVAETIGWSIGGVPPVCHETAVPTLFDETLLEYDTVWAAAGTPDAVWPVDPDRLLDLADARPLAF
ncbi:MAG: YbaK/EbsC family protein [Halanaeroarchaeum sp.]